MPNTIPDARATLLRELGVVVHGDEQVVATRLGELLTAVAMSDHEHYAFTRIRGLHDGRRHTAFEIHCASFATVSEADAIKLTEQVLARLNDEVAKRRWLCEEEVRALIGRTDAQDPVKLLESDNTCYADEREVTKLAYGLVDGMRYSTKEIAGITNRDPRWVETKVTNITACLRR